MSEDRKGFRDGLRFAVTFLHARARAMADGHAQGVLNGAAHALGAATAMALADRDAQAARLATKTNALRAAEQFLAEEVERREAGGTSMHPRDARAALAQVRAALADAPPRPLSGQQ